jgi:hypothetical protein
MNLLEAILGANDGAAVRQLGAQFGLPEDQATAAIGSLVPALAVGLQRNTASAGGLASLMNALASGGHQQYVELPASLARPEAVSDGNGILGHVFGSKEVSRQVAARAAVQTGIGEDVLKRMLPMVATLMMGALARHASSSAVAPPQATAAGSGSSILGMLSATLDRNRNGSMVDDLMGILGGALRS